MSANETQREEQRGSIVEAGKSAVGAAAEGAKTGAKVAVGALLTGCSTIIDLGRRAGRAPTVGGAGAPAAAPTPGRSAATTETEADTRGGLGPSSERIIGWWRPDGTPPEVGDAAIAEAVHRINRPVFLVQTDAGLGVAGGGRAAVGVDKSRDRDWLPMRAWAPALHPSALGDEGFRRDHGLRYAYVAGAMANGIGSEAVVEAMARTGMVAFFGAAGLTPARIEAAIDRIQRNCGDRTYGFNLIHSPNEPDLENAVVDLYLRRGVRLVSASAYLDLTLPLVRFRVHDIHRDADGRVVCPNRVVAKVSRVEVARKFFSPPPANLLAELVRTGAITTEQARLAETIPVALDLTAEADSGGHTDNRPAIALIPTMLALRDELQALNGYDRPLRVGAAGGIATPASAAAAFAMGAAYVLTGSINQACVEAGTSPIVRQMLAKAGQADVMMAPAADMFEMGVKVQVLKWGTMFGPRARRLYELYKECDGLDALSASQRAILEKDYFHCSVDEAWAQTRAFFESRDPRQIARAESDPKHKMALVFRSYLGRSSDWANKGEPSRKADYQIWCGPAMGAFNEWVRGSFLERPEQRDVATVAMNLMVGAAVLARAGALRAQGVALPAEAGRVRPMRPEEMAAILD